MHWSYPVPMGSQVPAPTIVAMDTFARRKVFRIAGQVAYAFGQALWQAGFIYVTPPTIGMNSPWERSTDHRPGRAEPSLGGQPPREHR